MKLKTKKKYFMLLIPVFLLLVIFIIFYVFIGFNDNTFKPYRDEDGHLILLQDIPYYGYMESAFLDEDVEKIKAFTQKCYVSAEYEDYVVYDYKDGIAISGYFGNESNLVIPETIDGKKVIKIGNYEGIDAAGDDYACFNAFLDTSYTRETTHIHIPSGVKDIVYGTFLGINGYKFKITVDKNNPYYYSFAGMLFSKETNKLLAAPRVGYDLADRMWERNDSF